MAGHKKTEEEKVKRKTISFKPKILEKLEQERGRKYLSTFINDHFSEVYFKQKGGKNL